MLKGAVISLAQYCFNKVQQKHGSACPSLSDSTEAPFYCPVKHFIILSLETLKGAVIDSGDC